MGNRKSRTSTKTTGGGSERRPQSRSRLVMTDTDDSGDEAIAWYGDISWDKQ